MNWRILSVGLLVTGPVLVFLALGFRNDPKQIDSPLIARPAPPFTLHDLDGRTVRLRALRGKPVVVNFWASWCSPCLVEHPVLIDASRRYQGRVHFVGVVYYDDPEHIREFEARRGRWGPTVVDTNGVVAIAYGVYGAPETFVLDAKGVVVEKLTGAVAPTELARILEGLIEPAVG